MEPVRRAGVSTQRSGRGISGLEKKGPGEGWKGPDLLCSLSNQAGKEAVTQLSAPSRGQATPPFTACTHILHNQGEGTGESARCGALPPNPRGAEQQAQPLPSSSLTPGRSASFPWATGTSQRHENQPGYRQQPQKQGNKTLADVPSSGGWCYRAVCSSKSLIPLASAMHRKSLGAGKGEAGSCHCGHLTGRS